MYVLSYILIRNDTVKNMFHKCIYSIFTLISSQIACQISSQASDWHNCLKYANFKKNKKKKVGSSWNDLTIARQIYNNTF